MKISRFPLSIVLWTLGFSSFAQSNCYPVEFHHGQLVVKIDSPGRAISLKFDPAAPLEIFGDSGVDMNWRPPTAFAKPLRWGRRPVDICKSVDGTLGFRALEGIWLLDFDRHELCKISHEEMESYKAKGFHSIKARLDNSGFSIAIGIHWKPYWFRANFKDRLAISARHNNPFKFLNEPHFTVESTEGKLKLFPNKPVHFLQSNYSVNIGINDAKQSVGTNFIKSFNWIFDFQSRRVSAVKNGHSITGLVVPKFEVGILKDSLLITRHRLDTGFKLGDVLLKVGNVEASTANLCQLAQMIVEGEHQVTLQRNIK